MHFLVIVQRFEHFYVIALYKLKYYYYYVRAHATMTPNRHGRVQTGVGPSQQAV